VIVLEAARPAPLEVAVRYAVIKIRRLLRNHIYVATSEAQLQAQVIRALAPITKRPWFPVATVDAEVIVRGGRLDILVTYLTGLGEVARVGLELKVGGSPAAVERQVMRYARGGDVDAVGMVTTSTTLARKVSQGFRWTGALSQVAPFGGLPFFVVPLRSF
jgi:hypothetical protein